MPRSISVTLMRALRVGCLGSALWLPINASASLLGDSVGVSFVAVNPDPFTLTDIVNVAGGPEIAFDDISNIGNSTDGVLFEGEYIDIGENSIVYHVQGGGSNLSTIDNVEYFDAGFVTGDRFVFSGLDFGFHTALTAVTISLEDVINVELGTDVIFDAHSLTLNLDRILVKYNNDGDPDFGNITLNLQFTPVPAPGALLLMASGLAVLSRSLFSGRKRVPLA